MSKRKSHREEKAVEKRTKIEEGEKEKERANEKESETSDKLNTSTAADYQSNTNSEISSEKEGGKRFLAFGDADEPESPREARQLFSRSIQRAKEVNASKNTDGRGRSNSEKIDELAECFWQITAVYFKELREARVNLRDDFSVEFMRFQNPFPVARQEGKAKGGEEDHDIDERGSGNERTFSSTVDILITYQMTKGCKVEERDEFRIKKVDCTDLLDELEENDSGQMMPETKKDRLDYAKITKSLRWLRARLRRCLASKGYAMDAFSVEISGVPPTTDCEKYYGVDITTNTKQGPVT